MTRANHPTGPVAASHRRHGVRRSNLALYGLRIAVGTLGRVCAYGLLAMVAFNDWRWFGLGVAIVALDELARP